MQKAKGTKAQRRKAKFETGEPLTFPSGHELTPSPLDIVDKISK